MKNFKLLWTGGWDSTFRLCDLVVNHRKVVEPHYLVDTGRLSLREELLAQEKIKQSLAVKFPYTSELFLPTKFVLVSDLKPNDDIHKAYLRLRDDVKFGSQYEWLAQYCFQNKIDDLELGFEKDPLNKKNLYLKPRLSKIKKDDFETYKIDFNLSDKVDQIVFGQYEWPLFDTTRMDMIEIAKKSGFYDILHHSWFCHTPVNGNPCGVCNPCKDVILYDFSYRLPFSAKVRNRVSFISISPIRKILKRLLV